MPLPLFLGIGAAIAAAAGVGTGVHGAVKMKEANDTMNSAQSQHNKNMKKFEEKNQKTNETMDTLGELELTILKSFETFSDIIEKIQNRPQFQEYNKNGVTLPTYDKEELHSVSVGAGVLLGGLSGAAVGTAGGFAAAGATTAAVMALGTASTGTAIASLSGAALTNATLAALGGGAIAAGGGGIALGTTILGATTLGVGLLVGGVIFSFTGSKLSDKADEAYHQMKEAEKTINTICDYLTDLQSVAQGYVNSLKSVKSRYDQSLGYISYVVNDLGKTDWNSFTDDEKLATQNTVLLVGLLYKMCQVNLVIKSDNEISAINTTEVNQVKKNASSVLADIGTEGPEKTINVCSDLEVLGYGAIYYYITQDYKKMLTLPAISEKQLSDELSRELIRLKYTSPMTISELKKCISNLNVGYVEILLEDIMNRIEFQGSITAAMQSKIHILEKYIEERRCI